MRRSSAAVAAFAASVGLVASSAEAHVGYPATELLLESPVGPRFVALTSYGMLLNASATDQWTWVCPAGVGYDDFEDPPIAVTDDGSILVGSVNGLFVSTDGGCDFRRSTAIGEHQVVALASNVADGLRVLGLFTRPTDSGFIDSLWESADAGRTWERVGAEFSADRFTLSVSVSPVAPLRVYVTVTPLDGAGAALLRSDDGGSTFAELPLPAGSLTSPPRLLAPHPTDPDVVVVRIDGVVRVERGERIAEPDLAFVSDDGGQTWLQTFTSPGEIIGSAFEPGGGRLLVAVADPRDGSDIDPRALGLWRAEGVAFEFERILDGSITCAAWDDRGIFACADPAEHGWDIGLSTDDGESFERFMDRQQIGGPAQCAENASTSVCAPVWAPTCEQVIGEGCGSTGEPTADAGPVPVEPAPDSPPDSRVEPAGGCGCRLDSRRAPSPMPLAIGALALARLRRRCG